MKFFIFIIVSIYFLCSVSPSFAQVVINEFSSGSSHSDWVELYNTGTASAQLSEYRLRDSTDSNKKDLDGVLEPQKWKSFSFSDRLNNGGDIVKLFRIDAGAEILIDEIKYGSEGGLCAPEDGQSMGRSPDGNSNIVRFVNATQDSANSGSISHCASPSPTHQPSPTVSASPKVSPTPTAVAIATIKPTPKASPKRASPTPKPSEDEDRELEIVSPTPESSPEVLGAAETKRSFPIGIVFVLGGLIFSGVAGFLGYKQMQKQGQSDSNSP